MVGIYIHNLKNKNGDQSLKGKNPFDDFSLTIDGKKKKLSAIIKSYDPPYKKSTNVYDYIKNHLEEWVEEAIEIKKKY